MATLVWAILCESFAIDRFTNRASLFDLIETIDANFDGEVPPVDPHGTIAVRMKLVAYWVRDDPEVAERFSLRYAMITPSGQTVEPNPHSEIDLAEFPRTRTFANINSIQWGGPGAYAFLLQCRDVGAESWKVAARVPFRINASTGTPMAPERGSREKTP